MSSRRYDSRCSSVQSSGIGVIEKNAFWPLSSGPGELSIAPPKARRKTGVQRISSGSSARPMRSLLRAERLDPGVLRAAEVEQVVRLGMLRGDRVEHAPDERALVVGQRLVAGHQVGHSSRASRTISARTAAYSRSAAARIRSGVSVVRAHRVAHLRPRTARRPSRPSPSLAGRTTSRRCVSNAASAASRGRRPPRSSRGCQRGDGRVAGALLGRAAARRRSARRSPAAA